MAAGTSAPIVGSSGAVSAVVGAYLALFPRARLGLVIPLGLFLEFVRIPAPLLIGFWAGLQLLFTYVGPAFGLAQRFSRFYAECPVLGEPDLDVRTSRLGFCMLTLRVLQTALALLAI